MPADVEAPANKKAAGVTLATPVFDKKAHEWFATASNPLYGDANSPSPQRQTPPDSIAAVHAPIASVRSQSILNAACLFAFQNRIRHIRGSFLYTPGCSLCEVLS